MTVKMAQRVGYLESVVITLTTASPLQPPFFMGQRNPMQAAYISPKASDYKFRRTECKGFLEDELRCIE